MKFFKMSWITLNPNALIVFHDSGFKNSVRMASLNETCASLIPKKLDATTIYKFKPLSQNYWKDSLRMAKKVLQPEINFHLP